MELDAQWVVGFVDGEGCFHVSLNPHSEMSLGYQVLPEFVVVQHKRDLQILHSLKRFFNGGVVRQNHGDRYCLRVRKLSVLNEVCEFFLAHPLKTKKNTDFRKFRRIINLMIAQQHLAQDGLLEILSIALEMNTTERPALESIRDELNKIG